MSLTVVEVYASGQHQTNLDMKQVQLLMKYGN